MKRVAFVLLFLFLVLSIVNVSALERTRVYGMTNPNANVNLKFSYYANGISYDQISKTQANDLGKWEYIFKTDLGEIELTVSTSTESKIFIVPVGPDFYASMDDTKEPLSSSADNTTETSAEDESAEESTEVAITEDETTQEKQTSGITGKAVSEENETSFDFKNYSIYLILVGLFITIIIANLVSHGILHLAKKSRNKEPREITVTKLSDKLAEKKKQDDEIEKQRYEQWKKEQEKQKKITELKKQLQDLGED